MSTRLFQRISDGSEAGFLYAILSAKCLARLAATERRGGGCLLAAERRLLSKSWWGLIVVVEVVVVIFMAAMSTMYFVGRRKDQSPKEIVSAPSIGAAEASVEVDDVGAAALCLGEISHPPRITRRWRRRVQPTPSPPPSHPSRVLAPKRRKVGKREYREIVRHDDFVYLTTEFLVVVSNGETFRVKRRL